MDQFSKRAVIVTGGSSGIGRATVELFAAEGAAVAVLDKDPFIPDERTADVQSFVLDARDERAVTAAIDAIVQTSGRLDVLVNAVGVEFVADIEETTLADFHRVLETNLTTHFIASRAAVRHLTRPGGVIVNVASQLALVGTGRFAAYTASKSAIVGFSRSLALELAAEGIRVNALCPGAVDTPLLRRQFEHGAGPQGSMADLIGMHPLGRLADASEIAAPIVFLASPGASFITGSTFVVDGGYTTQ